MKQEMLAAPASKCFSPIKMHFHRPSSLAESILICPRHAIHRHKNTLRIPSRLNCKCYYYFYY